MDLRSQSEPASPGTGIGESTPAWRKSGPEHFSPLAGLTTPKFQIPPCAGCGKPSFGGLIRGQMAESKSGAPVFDLEFWCLGCYPHETQVHSDALYPHYQLVHGVNSRRTYRRLTREQAIARVTA
jgi:hypothetical protein